MRMIRFSSRRFAPQNDYRLPQYRAVKRPPRQITLIDSRSTLPRELPNDVRREG